MDPLGGRLSSAPAAPRDPLGEALESRVAASERHGRGQYFTPDPLVDLVLSLVGRPPGPGGSVLDPSCGSGRFLIAAQALWSLEPGLLHGFETDPAALAAAAEQLPGAKLSEGDFLAAPRVADTSLVIGNPPYIRDRGAKRDLYADFIDASVAHLVEGGRLALVLSNAWLDVSYGRRVREQLLQTCALEWLVESSAERWFPGVRINTMVLIARRCSDRQAREAQPVRFAVVPRPLPAQPETIRTVAQGTLRPEPAWGPLLRAPELYFTLQRRSGPLPLVPLGELAQLHRGFTTNDNAFFYPPPGAGIESQYLEPLLKSPKRLRSVRGCADDLPERVFLCDRSRQELLDRGDLGALAWVDRHRPGQRASSWALPRQSPARLFVVKGTADRFRQPLLDEAVFADQQLYSVRSSIDGVDETVLAAVLNSSWCKLSMEMAGRVNFGDGVLWLSLGDVREQVLVPDLRLSQPDQRARLARAFQGLPDSRVPGLVGGAGSSEEQLLWDSAQQTLDAEVGALLGLSAAEQVQLQLALVERCSTRLRMSGARC